MYYIDVILPIPIRQAFTYSVNKDEALFLKPGMRVAVPFGRSKVYTAIVFRSATAQEPGYPTKSIDHILDEAPLINSHQLKHWQWMASYYLCTLGEVVRAALPSLFLLESETMVRLKETELIDESILDDDEFQVVEALGHQQTLHINDIRSILDRHSVVKVLQGLLEKDCILIHEEVQERYKPRLKTFIRLRADLHQESALNEVLEQMSRAHAQRLALMKMYLLTADPNTEDISQVDLQKASEVSPGVIKALLDKGLMEQYVKQMDRLDFYPGSVANLPQLSSHQLTALEEIEDYHGQELPVLLHGVTGSGKTALYIHLIARQLEAGNQVLYLVPEIALTTQLIQRLQAFFGEFLGVYHSRYNLQERAEVWHNVAAKKQKARLIIGARSAIFLPFQNLGLVVIDEEHEPSFKQHNPAPRYHGRDSALVLAQHHGARVVMGSATPSLESSYLADKGNYGLVKMPYRYNKMLMPQMELIDIREGYRKKRMTGHFSERLIEQMSESLESGSQVILFQNRRGYSPVLSCSTCGVVSECPNCDVSLSYHEYQQQLRCHYCGYSMPVPVECPACGSATLDAKGLGTQQVEAEVKELFPDYRVARMDQDTTRGKKAHSRLINQFEDREIDILVGTQMLAKGLDFAGVKLVGVMNADNLLSFPDFRAHERCFQLLVQVGGRSGRQSEQGLVLIQAFNPYHTILQQVTQYDYPAMYSQETEERRQFKYPPFYRVIRLTFKDRNRQKMQQASRWFATLLRHALQVEILGPEVPVIGRIRNQYLTHILIKFDRDLSAYAIKETIYRAENRFKGLKEFSTVRIVMDVDPY
ncbi:replication restart helicase PriA [Aureitalea marina]|uniref:Replication restart protein PriA n=1 Tax=Aureitalea marina TaxID=930804 RepID=A0A2S7KPL7_9FLAO|nr:primosomal protein N' [Aureitalea marina]PQB04550.1 primosomal protein N' [Aureitalea marina]